MKAARLALALRDGYNKLRRSFSRRRFGLSFFIPRCDRPFILTACGLQEYTVNRDNTRGILNRCNFGKFGISAFHTEQRCAKATLCVRIRRDENDEGEAFPINRDI